MSAAAIVRPNTTFCWFLGARFLRHSGGAFVAFAALFRFIHHNAIFAAHSFFNALVFVACTFASARFDCARSAVVYGSGL